MRRTMGWLALALVAALLIVHLAQRQLSALWPALGVHPEVSSALRASMEDQKRLARLDPERAAEYRAHFDAVRALHNRLEILRMGQEEIARAQERILFVVVASTFLLIGATYLLRRRREIGRLETIEAFLGRLSSGESSLRVGERGRDAIAKIAAMIERTSDVIGAQRARLRTLENLSTWQEAARRHAHEIRTPLTAAQLELDRLTGEMEARHPETGAWVRERRERIGRELERLSGFTKSFTSFAAIGRPQPAATELGAFVREFCETYRAAWPLALSLDGLPSSCMVEADRALTRQVLVNLCANSALANSRAVTFSIASGGGHATLLVSDDGEGIPTSIRPRLFDPYTTTRRVGEGMGLGLAIAKKIMLDQNGDLELVSSSPAGTRFRLTLPCAEGRCS
jgi:signal transduction histidine kinase